MSLAVTIYGASDDLIEVEGCKGADEFSAYANDLAVWGGDLIAPDGTQMRVYAIYDGCWHFSVGQVEEDVRLPGWPVQILQHESGYSTLLRIEAPDGTRLAFTSLADRGAR